VDLTGWKMDDSSASFGSAVALNGVTSIAPGESVIFIESADATAAALNFIFVWFNGFPPAGLQIGTYSGSGVGLGTGGDAVNLFDGSGVVQANVTFGAATSNLTFDNAAGLDGTAISQLSAAGINGAFAALNDSNQIGSPGAIAPSLIISEVAPWSSSIAPLSADWFEVTNTGPGAVDISGWKMDDSSASFGSAVALSGVTSIAAGESVVFIESADLPTVASNFNHVWFNDTPPAGLQIGAYNGSGVGLGTGGDAVNLFDGSGKVQANVTFGTATTNLTFDNAAGLDGTAISQLSAVGVNGAFAAPNDSNQIGSPGTIQNAVVPNTPPAVVGLAQGASGVFGDSTTPLFSGANGFPFTVTDAETALNALDVQISNNNASLVTATLVTVDAAQGQYRLDFSAPAGSPGIATIDVIVTDGDGAAGSDTFQYGVSTYDATRPNARYHTGMADASTAFALDETYMVVANDEDEVLRVYDRNNSGAPVAESDMRSSLGLTGSSEVDIEGSAYNGSTLFFIGSHGNNSSGEDRPNRERIFGVTVTGSGAGTVFTPAGYYPYFEDDLIAWDNANGHGLGAGYFGFAASAADGVLPEQAGGFNIEGLTFAPGSTTTLYVGFRAPLEPTGNRNQALIVPITNATTLFGAPSGSTAFGAPIQLDLGGRGIRSMECNNSGCLILAGSVDGNANFALYRWTGNPADAPVPTHTDLSNGSPYTPGLSPEGMILPVDATAAGSPIQFVSDNGDTVWYNNGVIAKDLSIDALKKFRSDFIDLGVDVTAPTVALSNQVTSLPEDTSTAAAIKVADITVTDADGVGTNTLSLSGADVSFFEIVGNALYIKAGSVLDFAGNPALDVTVNVDDATLGTSPDDSEALSIAITKANQAPTDLSLSNTSVAENQAAGVVVGDFTSTDPDSGNTFTYSLVAGLGSDDNAAFSITGNQLLSAQPFNFLAKNSYSVRVRTTDQGGLSFEKAFTISITDGPEIFTDVPASNWATGWIERLYNAGVTGGCSLAPLNFCPNTIVTRDQMAVFILLSEHGSAYTPPAATGAMFADVPQNHWAAAWIEQLANEGITGGCGGGNYCPDAPVTRAQMAVLLLRGKYGNSYTPPLATGAMFGDVPQNHWAAGWIEQLANEGITGGCGGGNYCPDAFITRDQMAVLLVTAFNLP
jgi:hypothetical protein